MRMYPCMNDYKAIVRLPTEELDCGPQESKEDAEKVAVEILEDHLRHNAGEIARKSLISAFEADG